MSNAAKHRKKAAEFEQLKQIDRAIASYIKAIEESESAGEDVDVALFNKVGDLALRQGRVPDAITYYERAVEHYATSGLFNNAIALCNKILRSAPGRANVYFTLGRICARKGLRGDATKNFLEYATRMREEGKTEEGMRALAEIVDLSPELTEIRKLVDEYAVRAGIALPRRVTPPVVAAVTDGTEQRAPFRDQKSQDLVFIHIDYGQDQPAPLSQHVRTPSRAAAAVVRPTPVTVIDKLAAAIIEPGPGFEFARLKVTPIALAPIVDVPADALTDGATDGATDAVRLEGLDVLGGLAGLEANGDYQLGGVATLEGLTVDETPTDAVGAILTPLEGMPLVPHDLESQAFGQVELMEEVEVVDFKHAADDPGVAKAIFTETPPYTDAIDVVDLPMIVVDPTPIVVDAIRLSPEEEAAIEPLLIEPVSELDDAIAAGAASAQRFETDAMEPLAFRLTPIDAPLVQPARITPLMIDLDLDMVEELASPTRPPFRIDPHDFILPGELPPLLLDDAVVDAGLAGETVSARRTPRFITPLSLTPASQEPIGTTPAESEATNARLGEVTTEPNDEQLLDVGEELAALSAPVTPLATLDTEPLVSAAMSESVLASEDSAAAQAVDEPTAERPESTGVLAESDTETSADVEEPEASEESLETDTEVRNAAPTVLSPTPSLPIAAVAAEATIVATSRRDALRTAVERLPKNWLLRRRLAEALFESGDTEEALRELETARQGLIEEGELSAAADIGEELVHVSPDRIAFHQRRVELSVRMHDLQRLRMAYLDLADALVRQGEESRARAVYARVLEIDPLDDRARAALGAAAPPLPPPAARPDDDFVDLSTWLKEDEGGGTATTRLRMREPVISGDEQADFDELLRHFKEGVARSLSEDDFESHYDLGVAYKEMGLLDDAIAEFQKALRSRGNRLPAYEALGQCFVEQGRHQVAATVLSRALHEPGLGDEQRVGVLYLLAFSCEALQRYDEARSYYQRVYATDIHFRDVAARLAALEQVVR